MITLHDSRDGRTHVECRFENETLAFYKAIQNKLHFAATGQTATEFIAERADANKPADTLAEEQYKAFSDRRRKILEAERDNIQSLENLDTNDRGAKGQGGRKESNVNKH